MCEELFPTVPTLSQLFQNFSKQASPRETARRLDRSSSSSRQISSSPVRGWLSASSHRDALHSVIRLVPLQPELSTLVVGLSNTHISGYGGWQGPGWSQL
ncbi:unnamed protein product [Boreogadus saida]